MRTTEELLLDATPFADEVIKKLPPRDDAYVTWNQYNQRMLWAHGAHSYSVTNTVAYPVATKMFQSLDDNDMPEFDGNEKALLVQRTQYVWAVSVRLHISADEWYDAVGEDSDPASAESNAYKRACAHAGIGLHLYTDDREENRYWLTGVLNKQINDEAISDGDLVDDSRPFVTEDE